MAKKKTGMSEGKQKIIQGLLEEYDIETAEDIQDALADLLGGTIKSMMEAEIPSLRWGRPWMIIWATIVMNVPRSQTLVMGIKRRKPAANTEKWTLRFLRIGREHLSRRS